MSHGITPTTYPLSDNTGLVPTGYSCVPRAKSVSDAPDENGNVAARTYYGGSGTIKDCQITLVLKSGTAPSSIVLGADTATGVTRWVTSVELATGNGQWPTYTINWKEGLTNVTGSKFTVSLPSVTPTKTAQKLGVGPATTVSATLKLTGSSATWSVDYAEQLGGHGEYAASSFSNGTAESSANGVVISGDPEWTAETGWTTEDGGAPIEETNTEYGTSSAKVSKFLVADTASAA